MNILLLIISISLFSIINCLNQRDLFINNNIFNIKDKLYLETSSSFHTSWTFVSNNHTFTTSNYKYHSLDDLLNYYKSNNYNFNDIKNIIPSYIGSIKPNYKYNFTYYGNLDWTSPCFRTNNSTLKIDILNKIIIITINSQNPESLFCSDWYFITTKESYHIKAIIFHGHNNLIINNLKDNEINDAIINGLHIFHFSDGLLGTLIDVFHAYKIFSEIFYIKDVKKFLETNMNISFIPRPIKSFYVNENDIMNGDLFIKTTLCGTNSLIMYGTGSRGGHMCVALWFDNELYITESSMEGIIKTPYKEWIKKQDPEVTYVIISRLRKEYRQKFNSSAAINFFNSIEGSSYGFSNLLYGWIDTLQDNYPYPINYNLIPTAAILFESFYPNIVYNSLIKGINQRLKYYFNITNINCSNMICVFEYLDKLNISLPYILTLVEKDIWNYPQGIQRVCSSYVMSLYKSAGIFDITDFEATEFTPKDVYQLNIFDNDWNMHEQCKVPGYNYCQIIGKHYWMLPGFNTINMYKNMNEKCGASPPHYIRHPEWC